MTGRKSISPVAMWTSACVCPCVCEGESGCVCACVYRCLCVQVGRIASRNTIFLQNLQLFFTSISFCASVDRFPGWIKCISTKFKPLLISAHCLLESVMCQLFQMPLTRYTLSHPRLKMRELYTDHSKPLLYRSVLRHNSAYILREWGRLNVNRVPNYSPSLIYLDSLSSRRQM